MNRQEKNSTTTAGPETDKEPILDQAKNAMTNVAGQAREQVTHQIDVQKDRAVETVHSVAGAIRETGNKLKDAGPLGDVAGRAADGIEQMASFFEGKGIADIARDVERFARREPAIFLGAAFTIGLIGGRFLKSSAPESSEGDDSDGSRYSPITGQRDVVSRPLEAPPMRAGYQQTETQGRGTSSGGVGMGGTVGSTTKPMGAIPRTGLDSLSSTGTLRNGRT